MSIANPAMNAWFAQYLRPQRPRMQINRISDVRSLGPPEQWEDPYEGLSAEEAAAVQAAQADSHGDPVSSELGIPYGSDLWAKAHLGRGEWPSVSSPKGIKPFATSEYTTNFLPGGHVSSDDPLRMWLWELERQAEDPARAMNAGEDEWAVERSIDAANDALALLDATRGMSENELRYNNLALRRWLTEAEGGYGDDE